MPTYSAAAQTFAFEATVNGGDAAPPNWPVDTPIILRFQSDEDREWEQLERSALSSNELRDVFSYLRSTGQAIA